MPANEYPSLSSPLPDDRTAKRVRGGAESSHGSVAKRRISASVASEAIARPSGTGNPACFSRAQLNALPPTRGRSSVATSTHEEATRSSPCVTLLTGGLLVRVQPEEPPSRFSCDRFGAQGQLASASLAPQPVRREARHLAAFGA